MKWNDWKLSFIKLAFLVRLTRLLRLHCNFTCHRATELLFSLAQEQNLLGWGNQTWVFPALSRSQITPKCGKNKKYSHFHYQSVSQNLWIFQACVSDVLTTFWGLLWSITEQMHNKIESFCFIIHNKETKTNIYDIGCSFVHQ